MAERYQDSTTETPDGKESNHPRSDSVDQTASNIGREPKNRFTIDDKVEALVSDQTCQDQTELSEDLVTLRIYFSCWLRSSLLFFVVFGAGCTRQLKRFV